MLKQTNKPTSNPPKKAVEDETTSQTMKELAGQVRKPSCVATAKENVAQEPKITTLDAKLGKAKEVCKRNFEVILGVE